MEKDTNCFTADVLHQKLRPLKNVITSQSQRIMRWPSHPADVSHIYRETADVSHVYHGETTASDTLRNLPATVQFPVRPRSSGIERTRMRVNAV